MGMGDPFLGISDPWREAKNLAKNAGWLAKPFEHKHLRQKNTVRTLRITNVAGTPETRLERRTRLR